MTTQNNCPACEKRLSEDALTLWDGQSYCRVCVQHFSPGLVRLVESGAPLEETVTQQQLSARNYVLMRAVPGWFAIIVLFGGVMLLSPPFDLQIFLTFVLFVTLFGVVYFSIRGLMEHAQLRADLPRTIAIKDGEVCVATPKGESRIRLTDCAWYFGGASADDVCQFTGLRRAVILQTPDQKFAFGHSPEALRQLSTFLSFIRLPWNPPLGCLRLAFIGVLAAIAGLLGGAGVGMLLAMATDNDKWIEGLTGLGVLDFVIAALHLATCTKQGARAARLATNPITIVLIFCILGASVSDACNGTIWMNVAFGLINGTLGLLLSWRCRVKIRQAEQQRAMP